MSRYIDAEKLKENFIGVYEDEINFSFDGYAIKCIDEAPSIDICFCRECKLGGTEDCPMDEIDDEYFCNFGEREGEE